MKCHFFFIFCSLKLLSFFNRTLKFFAIFLIIDGYSNLKGWFFWSFITSFFIWPLTMWTESVWYIDLLYLHLLFDAISILDWYSKLMHFCLMSKYETALRSDDLQSWPTSLFWVRGKYFEDFFSSTCFMSSGAAPDI